MKWSAAVLTVLLLCVVSASGDDRTLGTGLLREAVAFARGSGYGTLFLWTVRALTAAARRYRSCGFEKVEERPARQWGVDVVEERYVLARG